MFKRNFLVILFTLLLVSFFVPKNTFAQSLTFSQSTETLDVGESRTVSLVLDPNQREIAAVDVVIHFDPAHVNITNMVPHNTFATATSPLIDKETGVVRISLLNRPADVVVEKSEIATITYVGTSEVNQTALTFEFILGKNEDTNAVSSRGKDILKTVGNLILTIQKPSIVGVVNAVSQENEILPPPKYTSNPPFEIISPLSQSELTNSAIKVVETPKQSEDEINDVKFVLVIAAVFLIVGVIGFLVRVKQMFFDETTTLYTSSVT